CAAGPGLESGRRRIVLLDEAVPIEHPDRAVRSDFGVHGRGPLIRTGHEVPAIRLAETGTRALEHSAVHQSADGLVHERDPIPVLTRKAARRVQAMTTRRAEPAEVVHLSRRGNRVTRVVSIQARL